MIIFKVFVPGNGGTLSIDGIAYQSKLWLVPEWIYSPEEKISKPVRMIRFDNLRHEELLQPDLHKYSICQEVPSSVFRGEPTEGYETLQGNDITFGIRNEVSH